MPIPVFQEAAKELIRQAASHYKIKVKRLMQAFAFAQANVGASRQNFTCLMLGVAQRDTDEDKEQRKFLLSHIKSGEPLDIAFHNICYGKANKGTAPEIARLEFLYNVIDQFYYGSSTHFDFELYPKLSDLFGEKQVSAKSKPEPVSERAQMLMALVNSSKNDQNDAHDDSDDSLTFVVSAPRESPTASSSATLEHDPVTRKLTFLEHIQATTPIEDDERPPVPKSSIVDMNGQTHGVKRIVIPDAQDIIKWGTQQNDAFANIHNWLRTKRNVRKQVFRMFGYAGVGKTAMARHIANFVLTENGKQNVPIGEVLFTAYTGKACSVLRSKGCLNAATLHSLLYRPVIDPVTGLCSSFVPNHESPLTNCALLIIDEASMVPDEMAQDLLAFGCLVLVLGDPAQLPPVKGEGFFIVAQPEVMLTDIRRQAKDNPVIHLATRARKGLALKPGRYGDSVVYDYGKHVSDEMYEEHDQLLCGLNTTRRSINKRSRRINGKAEKNPVYPVAGDRLICLRNNKNNGLYNGTLWTASRPKLTKIMQKPYKTSTYLKMGKADVLAFKVRSLDEFDQDNNPIIIKTQVSPHHFNTNLVEPFWRDIVGSDVFDFGYGLSVHKAQGSQYPSVLLFDESPTFGADRWRHLYTGLTRTETRVSVLL